MPTPVYAQHLISLLKKCGLDQNTIASRLGTNKTSVSWWATGQRPVAKRHVAAFMRLVEETIRFAPASLRSELVTSVLAWAQELHIRLGDCQQEIQRHLSVLQSPYATRNPLSLDRRERQRLALAATGLAEQLALIDTVDPEAASFTVRMGDVDLSKPYVEPDPLMELARVAATYHITTEEEDAREAL